MAPINLPARLGKYELQEFLGGGMSQVYKAQDTVLGRTVAVKILTETGSTDPETKARFLQEARLAGSFSHDNIINVFDFGEDHGRPFIIMEFLRGETLKDAIRNNRMGDIKRKLEYSLQLARALEYIHTKKIIHRDIKPDNVHIDTTGRVKLMDFGIAKSPNVALTKVGFTLGTPYYMAPEQVLGQTVTPLADVYAFGIMMCEIITGSKPVTGESIDKVFQQILNEPLNLAPVRAAGAPPQLVDLIARCTAKNAQDRVPGFTAICTEMERMLGNSSSMGPPPVSRGGSMPIEPPVAPLPLPAPPREPVRVAPPPPPPPAYTPPAPAPKPPVVRVKPPVQVAPPAPAEEFPAWMSSLPKGMQTQGWFTAIACIGVLFGMGVIISILRLIMQAIR